MRLGKVYATNPAGTPAPSSAPADGNPITRWTRRKQRLATAAGCALFIAVLSPFATAKVHSNSMLPRPENLHLADVDGDGVAEWVGYENGSPYDPYGGGYVMSIARTDFYTTPLLTIDRRYRTTGNTATIFKLFTGHFIPGQESVCIYTSTGHVQCFVLYGTNWTYWYVDQPATPSWGNEIIVGDFDGDGLDEVLLYNRWTAAIEMWKYQTDTARFGPVTNFAPGNFGDDAAIIAGSPLVMVGDFADFGDGRRDDLVVCNGAGQVSRYDARSDAYGRTTFWIAFRTRPGVAHCGSSEGTTVANVAGWGFESLIVRDNSSGVIRFLDMRSMTPAGDLGPVSFPFTPPPDQGQIGPGDGILVWAKMSHWPGEFGTDTRDDVFLYTADTMLNRYDARFYAPTVAVTYWWGYSQWLGSVLTRMFSWAAP